MDGISPATRAVLLKAFEQEKRRHVTGDINVWRHKDYGSLASRLSLQTLVSSLANEASFLSLSHTHTRLHLACRAVCLVCV